MALLKRLKGDNGFALSSSLQGFGGKFAGGVVAIQGSNKSDTGVSPAWRYTSSPVGAINTLGSNVTGEVTIGFSSMSTNDALVYPWLNTSDAAVRLYSVNNQYQNLYASILVPNPDPAPQTSSLNLWRAALSYQLNLSKLASRFFALYTKPATAWNYTGFEGPSEFGAMFYTGIGTFWPNVIPLVEQFRVPPLFICQSSSPALASFVSVDGSTWPLASPAPNLIICIARGRSHEDVPISDPRKVMPILMDFRNERASYTSNGGWPTLYNPNASPVSSLWKTGPIPFQNNSYEQNFAGQLGLLSQSLNGMQGVALFDPAFAQRWSDDLLDVLSETNPKKLWLTNRNITRDGFFEGYSGIDQLGDEVADTPLKWQRLATIRLAAADHHDTTYWDVFPYDDVPPFPPDFMAGCRTAQVTIDEIEYTTIDGQPVDTIIPLYPLPASEPYGAPTLLSPTGKRNPPPGQRFVLGRQIPPMAFTLQTKAIDVQLIGYGVMKRDRQFDSITIETYTSGGQPFPFSRHDLLFYQGFIYFQ
jgi:hypothetical protein